MSPSRATATCMDLHERRRHRRSKENWTAIRPTTRLRVTGARPCASGVARVRVGWTSARLAGQTRAINEANTAQELRTCVVIWACRA